MKDVNLALITLNSDPATTTILPFGSISVACPDVQRNCTRKNAVFQLPAC